MAEDTGSKQLAAVGRLLSVLGFVMVGLVWFGDRLLAEIGLNLGQLSGPVVILGFVAITAGRAIKRRTTPKSPEPESPRPVVLQPRPEQPEPDVAGQPEPDVAATPPPVKSKPKPAAEPLQEERSEVATSLEQVLAQMEGGSTESAMETQSSMESVESLDVPPKTSAEMLEDAKHVFDTPPDSD